MLRVRVWHAEPDRAVDNIASRRDALRGALVEQLLDLARVEESFRELAAALPGTAGMHQQMRASQTTDSVVLNKGEVGAALKGAAHTIMQTYQGPYQAHAPFGPNCSLADVKKDSALVMCSTQNIYDTRNKVAQVLGRMPFHAWLLGGYLRMMPYWVDVR